MNIAKASGAAIATAAALMFGSLAAGTAGAAEEGKVQCMGANSCKGQSACKTATSACKGQNACKGQGFVEVSSQEECDEAKAKIEEEKQPEQPQ